MAKLFLKSFFGYGAHPRHIKLFLLFLTILSFCEDNITLMMYLFLTRTLGNQSFALQGVWFFFFPVHV